jgi:hypothetical protein
MDLKGFEAINQALASADVEATVTPEPADGEDVRFVTVETATDVQPYVLRRTKRRCNDLRPRAYASWRRAG